MTYSERVALAQSFIQSCVDQGISKDSPEMEACYNAEAQRDTVRREKSAENSEAWGMAVSEGMKSYGNSTARSSTYRQPTQCSSYSMGSSINTTCY